MKSARPVAAALAAFLLGFTAIVASDSASGQQFSFQDLFRPPRPGDPGRPPRPRDPNRPPRPGDPNRPPTAGVEPDEIATESQGSTTISGSVWVDNWFRLHVNGTEIIEDSASVDTERSFNAETFRFRAERPVTFAFIFRDYMQDETGLEYIGTRRQQMGDGGAIAQFTDATTGETIAVTDGRWRCLAVQRAPVEPACARLRDPVAGRGPCAQELHDIPAGWTRPDFDDSAWPAATVHSRREVGPKDGYDRIRWLPDAEFIWGPDLKRDNVLLCRFTAP